MGKGKLQKKLQPWAEARKRFRLSDVHVQMARELGMNPKKLGGLANHKQEPWKAPLPIFIEELYRSGSGETGLARCVRSKISPAKRASRPSRRRLDERTLDAVFIAEVPELPGCAADGATREEVLANAEVVIEEWLVTARELGRTIPEPKGRLMYA